MPPPVVNLQDKLNLVTAQWQPKIVARMNDCDVRLAKIEGEFVWHHHDETDEMFLVVEGRLQIDFRDGCATLGPGEMIVVPKGVEHRPRAEQECRIMLFELAGTVNTGDAGGDMTAPVDDWI